jgi:hypothetical protein
MRHEGVVRVRWTRAELTAIREALEITPNFEGRQEAREVLKHALRSPRLGDVSLDQLLAERLGARIVPIDGPTAMARAKLLLAVRGPRKRGVAEGMRGPRRPALGSTPSLTSVPVPAPVAASAAA